jgi:RNA polymerase sigma-70 factor (sigma-E family)
MAEDEFAEFYASCKDRCLRAAVASGMSPAAAEDAVAEAFARAFASWSTVRGHDAPAAWVVRTALNADISWWRRRRRETTTADQDHLELLRTDPAGATEAVLDAMDAIRRLPARQRDVVVLRHLLDLDTATTAAVLGIAPGTVTAHLHRAHLFLRAALTTDVHEGTPR